MLDAARFHQIINICIKNELQPFPIMICHLEGVIRFVKEKSVFVIILDVKRF